MLHTLIYHPIYKMIQSNSTVVFFLFVLLFISAMIMMFKMTVIQVGVKKDELSDLMKLAN